MNLFRSLVLVLFTALPATLWAQIDTAVFSLLDLQRPELEQVSRHYATGNTVQAAEALLSYYRTRTQPACPDVNLRQITITPDEQRWADEGMEHRFFVHTGYQPSYFYGDSINWQYWPVRDNELRWQLHRTKWWVPMGKAYRLSGEERYATAWCTQYLDWIAKNPLTPYNEAEATNWNTAPNVYFAWRPLEVSDRMEFQIHQFLYFLPAERFDAAFLTRFLVNYHRHARHLMAHFSAKGNHLLFQAQRLTFGGVFFPEFRDATIWRATGAAILNREIQEQVYDDGMQYELDPHYHLESINIFFKALRTMNANGYRGEFPASYLATIERMIAIHYNYSYPDYTTPMFSDAKLHDKESLLPCYREWAEVFPDNQALGRLAAEAIQGADPGYLSRAFRSSGFYILRNGWTVDASVLVLKAGPPAFWHCQPDNGTFEYWHKGRNFFPDSGSFVYAGDKEVTTQRDWFRQTQVHNTLTVEGRDLERTDSKCLYWSTEGETDVVVIENPSYAGVTHRRAVFFVDRQFYVLVDQATGEAQGNIELHYNLVECTPKEDFNTHCVTTRFDDGNNLTLRVFGAQGMERRRGWVSRTYRQRNPRQAYAFTLPKPAQQPVRLITVLLPTAQTPATIEARFTTEWSAEQCALEVKIDNKTYNLNYKLN